MDFKIDENGFLFLWRKDGYIKALCPFQHECWCGTWCPLLDEPIQIEKDDFKLGLCRKTLYGNCIDLRKRHNNRSKNDS